MRTIDFHAHPVPAILKKKAHFDANPRYDGIRERIYAENAARLLKEA